MAAILHHYLQFTILNAKYIILNRKFIIFNSDIHHF